jgi:hypothetical protein
VQRDSKGFYGMSFSSPIVPRKNPSSLLAKGIWKTCKTIVRPRPFKDIQFLCLSPTSLVPDERDQPPSPPATMEPRLAVL